MSNLANQEKEAIKGFDERQQNLTYHIFGMGWVGNFAACGSLVTKLYEFLETQKEFGTDKISGFHKTSFNSAEQRDFLNNQGYKFVLFLCAEEQITVTNFGPSDDPQKEEFRSTMDHWIQTKRAPMFPPVNRRQQGGITVVNLTDVIKNSREKELADLSNGRDVSGLMALTFKFFECEYDTNKTVKENFITLKQSDPDTFRKLALFISSAHYTDAGWFFEDLIGGCIESNTGIIGGTPELLEKVVIAEAAHSQNRKREEPFNLAEMWHNQAQRDR